MTKEELHGQVKEKRKATDKKKNKEVRKAAAIAAFSRAIESKRVLQNEIGDFSGNNVTGDALKDGSSGLLSVATVGIKNALKNLVMEFGKTVIRLAASALLKLAPILVVILLVCGGFFMISSSATSVIGGIIGGGGDAGLTELDVVGDGTMYAYAPLPQETIDDYINQLYALYADDMNEDRETVLRYALSKVGCAYNQAYHSSLTANIFDCSSLAYRSYREIGMDISTDGTYSAGYEYCKMEQTGRTVTSGGLKPGDLLFYYSGDSSKYKGIGHVAIYIGRIEINGVFVDKSVEALGKQWGVVVRDTKGNTFGVGRPIE